MTTKQQKKIDLDIKPIKDNRDYIKQTELMKNGTIPAGNANLIVIGKVKSGKSVLMANLLSRKEFFKGYFDIIFLFCLSASTVLKANVPEIKEERIYTDGDPSKLSAILTAQKKLIEQSGWKKAPSILVLCDDMASETRFMNSPALRMIFFSGSNSKISCWITSQSYVRVPRSMRLNADSIILFHGITTSEWTRFIDEHQPAEMTKNQFLELCHFATAQPYDFLFANCNVVDKKCKFRKKFDSILELTPSLSH